MKAKELTGMSDDQLSQTLTDTEKHLFQLRFQAATDRLDTTSELKKAKKDIARIKTEQRARQLAKLAKAPAAELAALATELTAKAEGDGPLRRRAHRQLKRVERLQAAQQPKPAAGKVPKQLRRGGSKGAGKRVKTTQRKAAKAAQKQKAQGK